MEKSETELESELEAVGLCGLPDLELVPDGLLISVVMAGQNSARAGSSSS